MTSVTVNNLHQEMTTQVVVVYIECYTTNAVKIFPFKFNHKANCHGQLTGKNKDNLLILIKYFDKQQYEQNNLDVPSYISVFSI